MVSDCLQGTMTQPPTYQGKEGASKSAEQIWDEIEAIVVKTCITV